MDNIWAWICTHKWTGRFDLDRKGVVISTPPIARWAKGKRITEIIRTLFLDDSLIDFNIYGWEEIVKESEDVVGG